MHLPTLRLLVALVACTPAVASAATIWVDTSDDRVFDDGNCSLREAILAANQNGPVDGCVPGEEGRDVIILADTIYWFDASEGGDSGTAYEVTDELIIRGEGVENTTIAADGLDRLFVVQPGGSLRLEDLRLSSGQAPSGTGIDEPGGDGGAILAAGPVHIARCLVDDNRAGAGGPGANGGGGGAIYTTAPLTIIDSEFLYNVSGNAGSLLEGGAPLPGSGGAIAALDTLLIVGTTIEVNHLGTAALGRAAPAGAGSAIAAHGPLVIRDSNISHNGTEGHLAERGTVWAGDTYTIERSSFYANEAELGSALYGAQAGRITNTTIAYNVGRTMDAAAGALFASAGTMKVHSSTVTRNGGGGLAAEEGARVEFQNSILMDNYETDVGGRRDCGGHLPSVRSMGSNLFGPATNCSTQPSDHFTEDRVLLDVEPSEHFLPTYFPLVAPSVAVYGGTCAPIDEGSGDPWVTDDILGKPRPSGRCSIGAFQYAEASLLFLIDDEPAGSNCTAGGSRIAIGMDQNYDGFLDEAEVESVAFVCHGAEGSPAESCTVEEGDGGEAIVRCPDGTSVVVPPGNPALIRMMEEPPGPDCEAGGQRIEVGRDRNGDGILDPGEVESEAYICSGVDGVDGADGSPGLPGAEGEAETCTVEKTKGGGARIVCPDGSTATVDGPKDPGGCTTSSGGLALSPLAALACWRLLPRRRRVDG